MPTLVFEGIDVATLVPDRGVVLGRGYSLVPWLTGTGTNLNFRAKISGGWLVYLQGPALTFVPDPHHEWDGGSLPDAGSDTVRR